MLGQRIEQRLSELSLSQDALATQLGVAQQTVSKWITGATVPRPAKIARLEDALKVQRGTLARLLVDDATERDDLTVPAGYDGRYNRLSPEDRRIVDDLIDRLLNEGDQP